MTRAPHVTVETRRVYRSARGCKLTRHAAYIAAAKQLIADWCADWSATRCAKVEGYAWCTEDNPCRFHKRYEAESYDYEGQPIGEVGMAYYTRVLPRLVRFLKYVDSRLATPARGAKP